MDDAISGEKTAFAYSDDISSRALTDAATAVRALIRERVGAGEKPEAVRSWLVERYGNWVTYDPPMQGVAGVLWIAPLGFLLFGLFLARGRFRRRRKG